MGQRLSTGRRFNEGMGFAGFAYRKLKQNKLLVAIALVFWLFLYLTTASRNYFYYVREGLPPSMPDIFISGLFIWGLAALFTPLIILLLRKIPLVFSSVYNVIIHLFVSILFVPLHAFMYRVCVLLWNNAELTAESVTAFLPQLMLALGAVSPLWYWLIVAVYYLRKYYEQYKQRELKNLELSAQLASIRLHVLKVQLHPHFLFNTLYNINTLIYEDPKTAERVLDLLSRFLAMSVHRVDDHEITLNEEIEFTSTYLEIEKVRFSNRFNVNIDIDPETYEAKVPSLLLQPLVENAVRHGISKKMKPGTVNIASRKEGDYLKLSVEDDGPGLSGNYNSGGIGIKNIKQRLAQLYKEYSFEMTESSMGGLKIYIEIPFSLNPN